MSTKRFAVFDIDGTLLRWQMTHAIFDQLGREGHLDPKEYDQMRRARLEWKKRKRPEGFREYEDVLLNIVHDSITNIDVTAFHQAVEANFREYKDQAYRYTRDLIGKLKRQGYVLLAISGSPIEMIARIADYYGFDDFVGSEHKHVNGHFTGEIVVAATSKSKILEQMVAKHNLDYKDSVGVGDGETDIGMLDMVEGAIAFNPSKKLFRHAKSKGWKIVIERKNMVYELVPTSQGQPYQLVRTNE